MYTKTFFMHVTFPALALVGSALALPQATDAIDPYANWQAPGPDDCMSTHPVHIPQNANCGQFAGHVPC